MSKVRKSFRSEGAAIDVEEPQVAPPQHDILMTDVITLNVSKRSKNGHLKMTQTQPEKAGAPQMLNVAILSEDGFEEVELTSPKKALEEAGIHVDVISTRKGKIKGWNKTEWGQEVKVDKALRDADPQIYDALVLPGGVMNPDKLRLSSEAVLFVRQFISTGRPVAAICHGPQTLIETGMIAGVTMTSWPSLKTDLRNAGVNWVDKDVVHHGQFITSRKPADLGAFNKELLHTLPMNGRRAA